MFIEPEELTTVISQWQLNNIEPDNNNVRHAILAAVDEAKSYLLGKYDCAVIFNAKGEDRNPTLVEHCKSITLWYLVRKCNTDLIYEQVKEYHKAAIDWLSRVAGVKAGEKPLTPDLPVAKNDNGEVRIALRSGSNPKFSHRF